MRRTSPAIASNPGTRRLRHSYGLARRAASFNQGQRLASSEREEPQLAEYIESRVLRWIKELEQIAYMALLQQGEGGPDYVLAAKILLGLLKFSSLNRQRIDLTPQVEMTTGPDLSGLSEGELRAIDLADDAQLNELALRIAKVKSSKLDLGKP